MIWKKIQVLGKNNGKTKLWSCYDDEFADARTLKMWKPNTFEILLLTIF